MYGSRGPENSWGISIRKEMKSMLKGYIRRAKSVKQQETPPVFFGLVVADQADVGFTWGKTIAYPQR